MYLNSNTQTNILFDTEMTKSIIALCELSGSDIPPVIDSLYINSVSKRIKDVILALKEQNEYQKERSQKYKKKFETLQTSYLLSSRISSRMIEEFKDKAHQHKQEIKQLKEELAKYKNSNISESINTDDDNNKTNIDIKDDIRNDESITTSSIVEDEPILLDEIIESKEEAAEIEEEVEIKQENTFEIDASKLLKIEKETQASQKTEMEPQKVQSALIIGNVGVILHQLKLIFSKFGSTTEMVKNDYEAISELKHKNFQCIVIDSKEMTQEELALIETIKKAIVICGKDTRIVALVHSIKDKKVTKQLKSQGADIIIEKVDGWQNNLVKELNLNCWHNSNKLSILK